MTNREVLIQLKKDLNAKGWWEIGWNLPEVMRLSQMEEENPEKMDEEYDGKLITPDKMTEEMKRERRVQESSSNRINKTEALSFDRATDTEDSAFSSAQNDPDKPKFSLSPSDATCT